MADFAYKRQKLEHYSIESASQELAACRRKVVELEAVILDLQKLERKEKLRKQTRKENVLLRILNLSQEFFSPDDLLRCIRVCKEWRSELDQKHFWRLTARNRWPNLLQDIETRIGAMDLDHKNFSIGLISPPLPEVSNIGEDWFPDPKLQLKHVYVLVEAKDKQSKAIIGTWYEDLFEVMRSRDMPSYKLAILEDETGISLPTKLEGQYSDHFGVDYDPREEIPDSIFEGLEFTIRFFRLDTGQTACYDFLVEDRGDDLGYFRIEKFSGDWNKNEAGCIARSLIHHRGYDSVDIKLQIGVHIDPSSINGDEAFNWRNVRYKLYHISCEFMAYEERRRGFESDQEFLTFLEGFHWC